MSKIYDVNSRLSRFYTFANVGSESYNPQIILYYNSSDELIKVEEIWRGETWVQTVSGTNSIGAPISQTIDYSVYYDAWVKS